MRGLGGPVTLSGTALLVVLGIIILLIAVIWSIKRHRDPELRVECDASVDTLIPSLAGLTLGSTTEGNSVEVLENGAFFEVLLAEIASARCSVHFETFLWKDGVLGRRLADALSAKARAGITVRVLLDANGTRKMGDAVQRQMKADHSLVADGRRFDAAAFVERDDMAAAAACRKVHVRGGAILAVNDVALLPRGGLTG